ncbi:MAG: SDR family NAD(P)-dependent oxidoreductase [Myxococcales bacterium]|nr:SDR family NAD(P)-dependent oxidoreductase [Myxococcales bacterium]MCB9669093.1 SDR family NAD(P)-dependent oxidoreductase [Alphaproteobacteria bacterium]
MHDDVTALVTGANRGLGRATAEGLARDGATVILACRDAERGEDAALEIREATGNTRVHAVPCDLEDPGSVDRCAESVLSRFPALHVVVANAGLTLLEREITGLDVERGWHAGYLGHFQLVSRLRERLVASAPARVVVLAGLYHRKGELRLDDLDWIERAWDWGQASADVQLARVMFAKELAVRLGSQGVTPVSVHPGAVRTHAQDVLPPHLRLLVDTVMRVAFVSPERGARTVLRLAEDEDLAPFAGAWFRRYHPAATHPAVDDPEARAALWEASERLV